MNAPEAGTIKEFLVNEEDTVTVGQDLLRLELGGPPEGGKKSPETVAKESASSEPTPKKDESKNEPAAPEQKPESKETKPEPKKEAPKSEPKKSDSKPAGMYPPRCELRRGYSFCDNGCILLTEL